MIYNFFISDETTNSPRLPEFYTVLNNVFSVLCEICACVIVLIMILYILFVFTLLSG